MTIDGRTAALKAEASQEQGDESRERILDAFRRWGYLQADLDPLRRLRPAPAAELDAAGERGSFARRFYCGAIGAEFMHIPDPARRLWIQERLEREPPPADSERVLARLVASEVFEDVLHARYPGTKRFSLEGATALIPLMDEILASSAAAGAIEIMLGMSHRGRLNVMVHVVDKDPADIFAGFEDTDPRSVLGGGDVKYHLGASGIYHTPDGKPLTVQVVSNPSHLEGSTQSFSAARGQGKYVSRTVTTHESSRWCCTATARLPVRESWRKRSTSLISTGLSSAGRFTSS